MIEVSNLQKSYGNKHALKGISFKVEKGEIFGFLGPNGAGKSTTVKILTGQLLPGYGHVRVLGSDISVFDRKLYSSMGIVPENTNLYERLTVAQNLEFYCRLFGCSTQPVSSLLEQVGLEKERNTIVKKLSKGMKQRVLLIRALLHNPGLLFLDEPTSGLDPASAGDIHDLLTGLNKEGVTIFLTSHNMEEVEKLCCRVAFLDQGLIAAQGTPRELRLMHSNNTLKVTVDESGMVSEKTLSMSGSESADLLAAWVRSGSIRSIHSCEPTLAEIFMKVTGRELK